MLEIHHGDEPEVLSEFRKNNPEPYDEDKNLWKKFRDFATKWGNGRNPLYGVLHAMQHGLCVYCERKIFAYPNTCKEGELNREIEHIRCRDKYREKMFHFPNMALACKIEGKRSQVTCGVKKNNRDLPILPTEKHAHLFSLDAADGSVIPSDDINDADRKRVLQCIEILNLNAPALCRERAQYIDHIREAAEMGTAVLRGYIEEITRDGEPFSPTLRRFLNIS